MELIYLIIVILIIVVLSALVSGTEAALLSITYTKVKELANGKKSGKEVILLKLKEELQDSITTIVILNNVINILGSIYVGVIAQEVFGVPIYLAIVSGALTFLIIMFSEIIPKMLGEKYSDTISLLAAYPLYLTIKLLSPVIYILNMLTSLFVKERIKSHVSEGEIKEMAVLGKQEGSIESYEGDVIENVFRLNDIAAYDVMIPKSKVECLEVSATFDDIAKKARDTGFTRFPVEKDGEIIGLINAKDLFRSVDSKETFSFSSIMRKVIFIPEVMKLSNVEKKLRRNRTHMAVIVNEHGDFMGIVTLEDIFEELLGEIEDEFDSEEKEVITKMSQTMYHVLGDCDIELLNEKFDLEIDTNEEYSTLNGFVVAELGKLPLINSKVEIEKAIFKVKKRSKTKALIIEMKLK